MPMQEFEDLINNVNDFGKSIDLIESRTKGQEYLDNLDEIGKGDAYIGYTEQEKADIAAGKKTPELGELIDFGLDSVLEDTTTNQTAKDIEQQEAARQAAAIAAAEAAEKAQNQGGGRDDGPAPSAPQKATETASYSNENEYESAAYDPPSQPDYSNVPSGKAPPSRGGDSGGPPSQGGGCCFIMLESRYGDGTMDKVVRRYRDEKMTPRNRRGYYKMARVLVPLMRKSKVFKWIVAKTFADPLVSYGKWYYGENKHGWIFAPVKTAWLKIFDVVGTDTVFIRENGEEV